MARYQKGTSGNPHGRPPRPKPEIVSPGPDPASGVPPAKPQTIDELVIAKLRAIVESEEDAGHVIRAARILVSEDLAAVIRHLEHDQGAEDLRRTKIETAVGLVLEHHPEVAPDQAERFARASLEAMEPTNLTEVLKDCLGFWKSEPLTDETLTQIWHELGLPGSPGPDPEPPPRCGLVELPRPDADCEYLQAQAVQRECQRRARIKHPGQVAPPPPPPPCGFRELDPPAAPEPEPPAPPESRPYVSFPGFDFYVKD